VLARLLDAGRTIAESGLVLVETVDRLLAAGRPLSDAAITADDQTARAVIVARTAADVGITAADMLTVLPFLRPRRLADTGVTFADLIATHAVLARLLFDTALELDDEISAGVVQITIPVILTIEDVNLVRLRIVDLVP
jgi:hypothetical protein